MGGPPWASPSRATWVAGCVAGMRVLRGVGAQLGETGAALVPGASARLAAQLSTAGRNLLFWAFFDNAVGRTSLERGFPHNEHNDSQEKQPWGQGYSGNSEAIPVGFPQTPLMQLFRACIEFRGFAAHRNSDQGRNGGRRAAGGANCQ